MAIRNEYRGISSTIEKNNTHEIPDTGLYKLLNNNALKRTA